MIVIAKPVGRLANRLLLFAHFIAAAAEHDLVVYNPALRPYARYFPATSGKLVPRWPPARRVPAFPGSRRLVDGTTRGAVRLLHALQARGRDVGLIRLQRDQILDLNSATFLDIVGRHRAVFVEDWYFRNTENCEKHHDTVCSYFTPHGCYLSRAEAVLAAPRRSDRLVVGIHIRQGDYERFKGGRYFYSHETYRRLMGEIAEAHPDRDLAFVLCSDAPIPRAPFSDFDVHYGDGEPVVDLYTFAACDRLVGPPSTYTRWASYYGSVPLLVVAEPEQHVDVDRFEVAGGLGWHPTTLHEWRPPAGPAGAATRRS